MGPSNRGRRLDGTILGLRRLGNLSVPFRLSPRWVGWLNPKWVPIPTAVATKSAPAGISAVSRAEISRSACYDRASMASGIIAIKMKQFVGMLLASVCMATCPGCKTAPELEVTITPPKVTIPDNSKRGTRLATVSVRWSDGAEFTGNVRLTKNPGGICQLAGMEMQLGRDTTKADDNTIPVCTVTAFKEGDGN
jgi:hypothetical protein